MIHLVGCHLPTPGFAFFWFQQNLIFYVAIFDIFKHANDFYFQDFWC